MNYLKATNDILIGCSKSVCSTEHKFRQIIQTSKKTKNFNVKHNAHLPINHQFLHSVMCE